MNNSKPKKQVNDYVLLFSAGAALSVIFLWLASYIFPEGEIIGGRRVFENIPKSVICFPFVQKIGQEDLKKKEK